MVNNLGAISSDSPMAEYNYVVNDQTAREALTGMTAGQTIFQADTGIIYKADSATTSVEAIAQVDLSTYGEYNYVVADQTEREALTGMTVGETIFQTDTGIIYKADSATTSVEVISGGGVGTTPNTDPNAVYNEGDLYTGKTGITYMYSVNADGLGNAGWIQIGILMKEGKVNKKRIISTSTYHTLFLLSDGTVKSVGYNNKGQLGNGNTTNQTTPAVVAGVSNCIGVAAGSSHSLFLINDGSVMGAGENTSGQLGDGSTTNRSTAVSMQNTGSNIFVVDIDGGLSSSIVLSNKGDIYGCGQQAGIIGSPGSNQSTLFLGGSGFKKVSAGGTRVWALTQGGEIVTSATFTLGVSGCIDISAGYDNCLFLYSDGTAQGVGENSYGQLGIGSASDKSTEQSIYINNCISIHAGGYHSMFILKDGTVMATGLNSYGQLGNGNTTNSNKPIISTNITQADNLSVGEHISFVLGNNGSIQALGYNAYGQFGDGTTNNSNTLVTVGGITLLKDLNITDPNNLI